MFLLSSLSLLLTFLVGEASASYRDLGIPASSSTVEVRVFNVQNVTLIDEAHTFIHPIVPGHETSSFTDHAFLVDHKESQKRILIDLGFRKDVLNYAPSITPFFTSGVVQIESLANDITDLLRDGGISLESIDAVIWSHTHFDHIGDMSKFPNSTRLVIGSETDTSTFPTFPNATLQESDLAGREIVKVNFTTAKLNFRGLKAVDYFGDGSLYLLNTPGHLPGHMSALARVTPTSFVLVGGDVFHYAGQIRPRPAFQMNFPCPAHLLEETKSSISTDYFWSPHSEDGVFDLSSRAQQLLAVSDTPDTFYAAPVTAQVSVDKVAAFDADPDVFVLVAHDASLRSSLPHFPASLNNWQAIQLKEKTVWNFVNKTNPGFVFGPM
ncbi:beta-lactamase-like protein [Mycena alexandri]|uniref:Beta-lactamase-like protein n=1 Tax=Mycena alexandri TaxID=1745969 RepID=A0AAD6TE76_9AGAR|nr:beta-lactamase-like protein [Mycena alexandri]